MKIKINSTDGRAKFIGRLNCMAEALEDLETEVDDLIAQREECCFPATNGVTNNESYVTNDGEIVTLDLTIP